MRAIVVEETGGPEVLRPTETADPVPGPGEAVVDIAARGVNFIEIYQRTGIYPVSLPWIPGSEGAGVVSAVGEGVTEVSVGDRVASVALRGSYAERAVAAAKDLVPVPDEVTLDQAAAVLLQGLTAHYLTHSTYPIQQGDTVLVHAAAGGTGQLIVQLAKRRGARVIGTVSTEAKERQARAVGADEVIRYTEQDVTTEVRRLTGGEGVPVVYDGVGAATFDVSLACLRPRGMLVLFGQSSGVVPPFDPQRLNAAGSVYLTRPSLGHYTRTREELLERASAVLGLVASGELAVQIGGRYPLAEASRAHTDLASRATMGKLLLVD
ncbi:quinone oxidoreductase [Thermobifida fusca]|jgi:NADPH:quinone reductase|uniref:Quinone oxidoreductase n=2 Tax=Thermobifida fusca TaxID=2021 RepID=A0A9P2WPJ8_THEFU|nr:MULTISPECIES: quinone oxidoreductase [Thermobifida]AAZ56261.1 putative quinone oxidoreductase [Thermobifida fusca YX]EOR70712.1 quinone oxidoreductase [Thermobifida fusca TM51]MBO2530334.1 quinone oxidoreductase [Thermobifida sp.]MDD6793584.1 quinone oxidoreductase [Thermobifida fusca]PPS95853.1 NADPH--quinone reductase [Thermobifida fusca]